MSTNAAAAPRIPAIRTPTWQDPILAELRELATRIPAEQARVHEQLATLIAEVDYTAWQPDYAWPGPGPLATALGLPGGGIYWTVPVAALLWAALQYCKPPSLKAAFLVDAVRAALAAVPIDKYMDERAIASVRRYQEQTK